MSIYIYREKEIERERDPAGPARLLRVSGASEMC